MSQASASMAMATTPPVTVVCSGTSSLLTTVAMIPSFMGLPATSGQHDVVLLPLRDLGGVVSPCHCATAATSISDASSGLCQLCHGFSPDRFLFQS